MKTNIIKEELQNLRDLSEKCEQKQKEFLSKKKLINPKTGEIKDLDYNLKKEYQLRYNDLIYKSIFFQKEFQEKYQDDFTALFITITANTQYHKYKQDNQGNLILNPNYQGYTIKEAYELISKVKRTFYNELTKEDNGRIKVDCRFLQVVEKHNSLTPHLHIVLFIPKQHTEYTINIIKRKMKCTDEKRVIVDDDKKPINKYIINSNYQKNKLNDVGRCEIEILQDSKKVTGYVSKYIKKQFQSDDLNYIRELDGWKRKNKITLVLTSRTPVPKYVYKTIVSNLKEDDKIKFEDLFCDIQKNTTLVKNNIQTKKTKIKEASKEEIFKATATISTKEVTKKELDDEISTIKKLCARELDEVHTKLEVNINLKIFDLFISNVSIKNLNNIKQIAMIDNFITKDKNPYNDPIYLDNKTANKYFKWLKQLLKHLKKMNISTDKYKNIKITKIERLVIEYHKNIIYDSDDWELIEVNENKKVA